jgi:excisionase family DNA binding protein
MDSAKESSMSLSVRQAAERLRVTEQEIRRLISAGELAADRFGETGQWAVDARAVAQRAARSPSRGRPWEPAVAWAALWLLSGHPADWLSASDRSRLRRRMREIEPDALAIATRKRAFVESGRVLPEYVDRLASAQGVVRTGVSATAEAGADLVSTGAVDIYSPTTLRPLLIAQFGVDLASRNPNVVLRTLPANILPVLGDRDVMPSAVVAVDLLDSTDPRTVRAGRDVLIQLLERARS